MITAAILAVCGFLLWISATLRGIKQAKKEIIVKEIKDEAEKTVKNKTAGELVDDFNKRMSASDGRK